MSTQSEPSTMSKRSAITVHSSSLTVFAVALTMRIWHLVDIRQAPFFPMRLGDSLSYHNWALEVAQGNWIGTEVFYQAPLYPYCLAVIYWLFGSSRLTVVLIQSILGSVACVLLADTTARLISRRAGIAAGLLLACYPTAIFFDSLIQKSTLGLFLLCLMVRLLTAWTQQHSRKAAFLTGVTTGLLVLTRENAIVFLLGIVLAGAFMQRRRRTTALSTVSVFLLGAAVSLTPVAIRNFVVGGEFHLTTSQFGPNFYIGNNELANGMYQPLKPGGGDPSRERIDATQLAEEATGRKLTPAEVSKYWTQQAFGFIRSQPLAWLRLMGRKFVLLWNRVEITDTEDIYTYSEWSTPLRILLPWFSFGTVAPLGFLGIWMTWSKRDRLWLLYLMLAVYAGSVWLFYVFGRYRYPLVPLLMIFAGGALAAGLPSVRRDSVRRVVSIAAVGLLLVIFCNWPVINTDRMKSITLFNMATVFDSRHDTGRAIEYYGRTIELNPNDIDARMSLGDVLFSQGRLGRAEQEYRAAVRILPELPSPHFQIANICAREERLAEAVTHYQTAIEREPRFVQAHLNLGVTFRRLDESERAIAEFRTAIDIDPAYERARMSLATSLADSGQLQESVQHYEILLHDNPRHPTARQHLQAVYRKLSETP